MKTHFRIMTKQSLFFYLAVSLLVAASLACGLGVKPIPTSTPMPPTPVPSTPTATPMPPTDTPAPTQNPLFQMDLSEIALQSSDLTSDFQQTENSTIADEEGVINFYSVSFGWSTTGIGNVIRVFENETLASEYFQDEAAASLDNQFDIPTFGDESIAIKSETMGINIVMLAWRNTETYIFLRYASQEATMQSVIDESLRLAQQIDARLENSTPLNPQTSTSMPTPGSVLPTATSIPSEVIVLVNPEAMEVVNSWNGSIHAFTPLNNPVQDLKGLAAESVGFWNNSGLGMDLYTEVQELFEADGEAKDEGLYACPDAANVFLECPNIQIYFTDDSIDSVVGGVRVVFGLSQTSAPQNTLFSADFNDPSFDGGFDPSQWTSPMDYPAISIAQTDGAMVLSKPSSDGTEYGNLSTIQTWSLGEFSYLEARLKLDQEHIGEMGNAGFSLGNVGCFVQIQGEDTAPFIWCAQSHTDSNQQWIADYMSGSYFIEYDQWYTVRVEFNSQSNEFNCTIDGNPFFSWQPANIDDLLRGEFSVSLSVWAANGTAITSYVDDLLIVK